MHVVRSMMLVLVALLVWLPAYAAQQPVPTKALLVKNPPSGARKVLWKVKETASTATVAGDPTADGATLRIQLTPGGDQCVTMPASGWSVIGTLGFKYKDPTLANGPVKVAQIKKTPSGTFLVKALLKNGGPTSISVTPGNQTTTYATNFTLGTGDDYCGGTATATPNPNNAVTFKVSNDGAPAGCITACTTSTTSTTLPSCTVPADATWACCIANIPGQGCAREIHGNASAQGGWYTTCVFTYGGTVQPGRCPDPLCGQSLGCCLAAPNTIGASCVDVSGFGTGSDVQGFENFCAAADGSYVAGRCP